MMVGPLPAGRRWTEEEERRLIELLRSGMKAPAVARLLKRSPGAVYARINALKKTSAPATSLPSERLAFFRTDVSSRNVKICH
jgi:hypothetical protein